MINLRKLSACRRLEAPAHYLTLRIDNLTNLLDNATPLARENIPRHEHRVGASCIRRLLPERTICRRILHGRRKHNAKQEHRLESHILNRQYCEATSQSSAESE